MIADEKRNINASFEMIRRELKKYNAEDNDTPTKLLIADRNDFLKLKQKRNSQFIIGVKEFVETDRALVKTMLNDLEKRSGRKPLAFFYNDKEIIETVIADFEDFYNMPLRKNIFQKIGSSKSPAELQFCLVIVVMENYYYES